MPERSEPKRVDAFEPHGLSEGDLAPWCGLLPQRKRQARLEVPRRVLRGAVRGLLRNPGAVCGEYPEVYAQLARFYGRDPAQGLPQRGQRSTAGD
jgi:hypothetical protein